MPQIVFPMNIGKRRKITAIDGKRRCFTIEDELMREQKGSIHRKLIYFQKLRHEPDGRLEYRFTYYMQGVNGRTKGRWVFGQYSLMIPHRDLIWLLKQVQKKGWKGF